MRYLFAFLLAALVSPCWANPWDNPKSPLYTSPEERAAHRQAIGEQNAARILADQQRESSGERETTVQVVAVIIGVIVCVGIASYAVTRKRPVNR